MNSEPKACDDRQDRRPAAAGSFDEEPVRRGYPRASKMGRRRAWVLLAIHVAIFGHILHWQLAGETLAPLEPSEAMYTTARGAVNAGAILLIVSMLSVLILGRWFCGWACHLVALQDGSAWLLKKMGVRPRPLRSRALALVPLGAGLFMFGFPLYARYAKDLGLPEFGLAITKTEFWETFPGFWVGLATFVFCGFAMVYLLGAKGFCFYACPYGGLFGVVDRFAPARIRVTDACKGCGHCSAVCTSNVRVADEVARFGAVVDSGCMKCMDCVSVCPEEALYFGFGKPAAAMKARSKPRWTSQFSWAEEGLLGLAFAGTLFVTVGLPEDFFPWCSRLYAQLPLLFALGIASTTAFLALYVGKTLRRRDLSFQNWTLRRDGRLTRAGRVLLALAGLWLAFVLHSAWVQSLTWRGYRIMGQDAVAAVPVAPGSLERASSAEARPLVMKARTLLDRAAAWGLFPDPLVSNRRAKLAVMIGDLPEATRLLEASIAAAPDFATSYLELALLQVGQGQMALAAANALRAASKAPDDEELKNTVRRIVFSKAEQEAMGGEFERAIRTIESVRPFTPPSAELDEFVNLLRAQIPR
ncbi:MAG: 4Fe-4S binding protein [Planctomycetes bacterium]|nr:4Fe-4S binding protein [Planctomycetota bacterium]